MYQTKFSFSRNDYLLDCDTILKYKLKSRYEIPKIKELIIQISLKNLLLASDFVNKDTFNKNIQLRRLLILYIISSALPYISFYNYKNSRFLRDKNNGDFIIRLNISDKNTINDVLKDLYLNNLTIFSDKDIRKREKSLSLSYNLNVSSHLFQDVNNCFKKAKSVLDIEKVNIQLSLIYNKIKIKDKNILNILKNNSSFG